MAEFWNPTGTEELTGVLPLAVALGDDLSVNSSSRCSIIDTIALGGPALSTRGSKASDKPSDNALRQGPT